MADIWIIGISLIVVLVCVGEYWREKIIWDGIEEMERLRKEYFTKIIMLQLQQEKNDG